MTDEDAPRVASESLTLLRTEEWYKFDELEPDGFKSFILGVYEFDQTEVVVVSEAAFNLMQNREDDREGDEGEWVLVSYGRVNSALSEKGWGRV